MRCSNHRATHFFVHLFCVDAKLSYLCKNIRSIISFVIMKKNFYKCVSKVCTVSLTLLGFTAPITLASCYGPMPDRHYSADELVDSIDSVSEDIVDSLALVPEDLQAVEGSDLQEGAEQGEE